MGKHLQYMWGSVGGRHGHALAVSFAAAGVPVVG